MSNNKIDERDKEPITVKIGKLIYSLDKKKKKTSNIIGITDRIGDLYIPRSITYELQEFIVTSINKYAFSISCFKTIQFAPESKQIELFVKMHLNHAQLRAFVSHVMLQKYAIMLF